MKRLTTGDLKAILSQFGAPAANLTYGGTAQTYITYQIYDETGQDFADDQEISGSYFVQVNIFSKSNYEELVNNVYDAMIENGFTRMFGTEFFENDTKFYHKVYRFEKTIDYN